MSQVKDYNTKDRPRPLKTGVNTNTDYEVCSLDAMRADQFLRKLPWWHNLKYALFGLIFGIVLVKSELISWFRMQEMFRLQSFHMFGIMGTAVVIGAVSVALIRKFDVKTINGGKIEFQAKKFNKGQVIGGLIFGFGWAMTGACPGPLFAQIGTGALVIVVTLLSAIAGTWVYGYFRDKLPH